jgi:hypothetical protein
MLLADLQRKHAAATVRQTELSMERRQIAYAAHTGDDAARARLDELIAEDASLAGEIASLAEAAAEARNRLAEAQRAEAQAAERDLAGDVVKKVREFRKHGTELDRLAQQLVTQFTNLADEAATIRALGVPLAASGLIRVNCARALQSALIPAGLDVERVPPNQRHSFTELVDGWTRGAEVWAKARLAEPTQQPEKEILNG